MAETIEIACPVQGHEGEAVLFKRQGWKYKHLRLWQEGLGYGNISITELTELEAERIKGWTLKSEDGQTVEFKPGTETFDKLEPAVARWIVGPAFRQAYVEAETPVPN